MPRANINDHVMYYDLVGPEGGARVVCMGGWGTFCHGQEDNMPRTLVANNRILCFDYRGIGESSDPTGVEPSIALHSNDLAALLDHLNWKDVHIIGLVGMGACVGQELAIIRPDLVRSVVMTGCWAWADAKLADVLKVMGLVHRDSGFEVFQQLVASLSFERTFYAENRERILGSNGAWNDLDGRVDAHLRLIEACVSHDVRDRLSSITKPVLVLHSELDSMATPRYTREIEALVPNAVGVTWSDAAHVLAGRELKVRFDELLEKFLSAPENFQALRYDHRSA